MEPTGKITLFRHNPKSWAHRRERIVMAALRFMTYFIIVCAAVLFLNIIVKGAGTVFSTHFPFVNMEFLTGSPETLHVFDWNGQHMEMADTQFRAWAAANGIDAATFKDATYAYSAAASCPRFSARFSSSSAP